PPLRPARQWPPARPTAPVQRRRTAPPPAAASETAPETAAPRRSGCGAPIPTLPWQPASDVPASRRGLQKPYPSHLSLTLRVAACAPPLQCIDQQQQSERGHQHHRADGRCTAIVILLRLGDDQQRRNFRGVGNVAGDE